MPSLVQGVHKLSRKVYRSGSLCYLFVFGKATIFPKGCSECHPKVRWSLLTILEMMPQNLRAFIRVQNRLPKFANDIPNFLLFLMQYASQLTKKNSSAFKFACQNHKKVKSPASNTRAIAKNNEVCRGGFWFQLEPDISAWFNCIISRISSWDNLDVNQKFQIFVKVYPKS